MEKYPDEWYRSDYSYRLDGEYFPSVVLAHRYLKKVVGLSDHDATAYLTMLREEGWRGIKTYQASSC